VNYSDIFNLKGDPKSAVPTVFTYSNKSNSTASANIDTYDNYFYLVISDAWNVNSSGYWYGSMTKRLNNANSSMGYYSYDSWCDGWYTKPLGETLNAGVKTSTSRWNDYHRFNVVMDCRPGDVNFDAQLNITDMQRTLNYALDSTYYNRYTPFNFTAANLIATDRTINVQDVVANINLLLDSGVTPKLAKGNRSKDTAQDEEPEAVLYVKDGVTVGIGTGEQDRVGVAEIARDKAYRKLADLICFDKYQVPYNDLQLRFGDEGLKYKAEIDEETAARKGGLPGCAMVSDAFFPFRDGAEVGIREGITSIVQPGGAIRDWDVIDCCNDAGVAMVFTGQRSFKH
jgi:hypothetical protein